MGIHSLYRGDVNGIHVPHQWTYASAALRNAATGFQVTDVYKLALQTDNNTLWILIATSPTWIPLGGVTLPFSLGTPTTADALADTLLAASATSQKPLVIQLLAGQVANGLEIQDSTGLVLFSVTPNGVVSCNAYNGNGNTLSFPGVVADGTYTVGLGTTTNGSITTLNGMIIAITQAS